MRSFALLLLALAAHCIIAAPHDRPLRGRANFHKSVGKQARSIGRLGLAGNANVTTHTIPPSLGTTFKTFKASTNTISLSGARRGDVRSMQPMMYFQQHANRALARLSLMSGRALNPGHLEENMRKRWLLINDDRIKSLKRFRKRHRDTRAGSDGRADNSDQARSRNAPCVTQSMAGVPASEAGAGLLTTRRLTDSIARGTQSLSAALSTKTASVSDAMVADNSQGFSEVELTAILDNLETAGPADVANVLGLAIQSNDVGYFATMQIGTPPRPFKVLVDSGSADFWLASAACRVCDAHQQLGSQLSSSFRASNTPFQVVYGAGAVAGVVIQDNVQIGNLSLTAHTFGVATQQTEEFSAETVLFDGLMGTAKGQLSNQGVPTAIESLAAQGSVIQAQMGYALGRVADGNNQGTVTFGGVNQAQIAGELVEIPNVSQVGFWEAAVDDLTVNGRSLGLQGRTAILDTGTTLIIMPDADARALHAAIPGSSGPDAQGAFTIPCDSNASVAFTMGGKSFSIDPRDLSFLPVSGRDLTGDCVSGIMAGEIGGPSQYLVGDVFLKSTYFATDVDTNTMGLAKQA